MTKTGPALTASAEVIQALYKLNCSQVLFLANTITYRSPEAILFGDKQMTLGEFCKEWEGYQADAFAVRVWAGPPGKARWCLIPLATFVVDWYFLAVARGNHYMTKRIEDFVLETK